ncbi:hypothetical protein D7X33_43350, partial [Butyricicoccus sp. 1XD8-22]
MDQIINGLIHEVLKLLKQEGYTERGVKKHAQTYSLLVSYADKVGQLKYSEELGQAFVRERYGASFDTRRGNNSEYVTEKIRHLKKLWHFQQYGTIHFAIRGGKKKTFQCPKCFSKAYDKFLNYCENKGYSNHSRRSLIYPVRKFLTFLEAKKISSMDDILAETITSFMSLYIDCSKIYLKSLTSKLSVFFRFLFENELVSHELHTFLPDIR